MNLAVKRERANSEIKLGSQTRKEFCRSGEKQNGLLLLVLLGQFLFHLASTMIHAPKIRDPMKGLGNPTHDTFVLGIEVSAPAFQ